MAQPPISLHPFYKNDTKSTPHFFNISVPCRNFHSCIQGDKLVLTWRIKLS